MDLKSILKSFKLNESTISMVLGAIVVVVVGILVVNYFRDRLGGLLPGLSTEQEEVSTKVHTVAKGETLWSISEKYFGSGYNWVDIAQENKLSDSNKIEEGQVLTIPSVEAKQQTAKAPETVSGESITGATYEVVKGDSLWNIAVRAYGDGYRWVEIARENKLANPNLIHSGNILVLPR